MGAPYMYIYDISSLRVKRAITTAAKETLRKLQQQPRIPWISETTMTLIEQRRKHKHDKNQSEYNRLRNLINRQTKKAKKNGLDNTEKKLKTSSTEEIPKRHTTLLEGLFGNPN
jgi:catalase